MSTDRGTGDHSYLKRLTFYRFLGTDRILNSLTETRRDERRLKADDLNIKPGPFR